MLMIRVCEKPGLYKISQEQRLHEMSPSWAVEPTSVNVSEATDRWHLRTLRKGTETQAEFHKNPQESSEPEV